MTTHTGRGQKMNRPPMTEPTRDRSADRGGDPVTENIASGANASGGRQPSQPSLANRLRMTLLAWVAAFLIVLALLSIVGEELQRQPLAIRVLVMTGVMVILMVNVVEPVTRRVLRRLANKASATAPRPHAFEGPANQEG